MKKLDSKAIWLFMVERNVLGAIVFLYYFVSVILMSVFSSVDEMNTLAIIFVLLASLVPVFVLDYIYAALTYKYYKYDLASDAYHSEQGIISKKYISIPYERIQNVNIHRGLLARILGLSDIDIQTAGSSVPGFSAEGRLPGVDQEDAIKIRDELIRLSKAARSSSSGL